MVTPAVTTVDITDAGPVLVHNIEAVAMQATHRLRLLLTEWFLDIFEGVPYELILTGRLTPAQVSAIFVEEIRKIRHVLSVEVTRSELNSRTRQYVFSATLTTDFNESTTIEVTT